MNSSDPFDTIAWQHEIRTLADAYMRADDSLRQANDELKPYRRAKKEAREKLEDLMTRHRIPLVPFDERNESLVLAQRTVKKRPDDEKLKERCLALCRKDQMEADKMFEFLTKKVEEPGVSLRRKKMPAPTAAQADV